MKDHHACIPVDASVRYDVLLIGLRRIHWLLGKGYHCQALLCIEVISVWHVLESEPVSKCDEIVLLLIEDICLDLI